MLRNSGVRRAFFTSEGVVFLQLFLIVTVVSSVEGMYFIVVVSDSITTVEAVIFQALYRVIIAGVQE